MKKENKKKEKKLSLKKLQLAKINNPNKILGGNQDLIINDCTSPDGSNNGGGYDTSR